MKILVIRFSSIGDIILTSPVIRCLAEQLNAEIHFLTKVQFVPLVKHNPHIIKVHGFKDEDDISDDLKNESFDLIIDLHNNIRSAKIKSGIKTKSYTYDKASLNRWLLVNFKIDRLKGQHIVDRYFTAVEKMAVKNDNKGLEFFFPTDYQIKNNLKNFVLIAVGTAHATKDIPVDLLCAIINGLKNDVVLIGGKEHETKAGEIEGRCSIKANLVGKTDLLESAALIKQSTLVISPDTGMMHLAAALNKKLVVIYGSTASSLGFRPYMQDQNRFEIIENTGLNCRPCTKQGRKACPKAHFKCMNDLNSQDIVEKARQLIEN